MKKNNLIKEDITNYAYNMILEFINRVILNINMLGILNLSSFTNPSMEETINENLNLLIELIREFYNKKIIEINESLQISILLPFKFKNSIKKISIYSIDFSLFFVIMDKEKKILAIKEKDNIYTKDYDTYFQNLSTSCLNLKKLIQQIINNLFMK
jgi:hypothetical protein